MSDKQIVTKLQIAQKSGNLSLASSNLFKIPEKVFFIITLLRLDISNNNIEVIPSDIGNLVKLKQLWANQNPIRCLPAEIYKCVALESLDLSYTKIVMLPREIANVHKLNDIKLDNCPLEEKFLFAYRQGIAHLWKFLKRKVDRKKYKEEVFRRLRENVYPAEDPRQVMELTLNVFRCLKNVETSGLKMLVHNMNRIFPEKIGYADPERIRDKIQNIENDLAKREELSLLTLKLKSKYPLEDLSKIANMALTLDQTYSKPELNTIFKRRMLPDNFNDMELPALSMSLNTLREKHDHQIARAKLALLSKLKTIYGTAENQDLIQQISEEFSENFENPEEIRRFIRVSADYLPEKLEGLDSAAVFHNFSMGNSIIH